MDDRNGLFIEKVQCKIFIQNDWFLTRLRGGDFVFVRFVTISINRDDINFVSHLVINFNFFIRLFDNRLYTLFQCKHMTSSQLGLGY